MKENCIRVKVWPDIVRKQTSESCGLHDPGMVENVRSFDGIVAIITSEHKSEGQLMEIGALQSKEKPVFIHA
jgi:hypothetical protein